MGAGAHTCECIRVLVSVSAVVVGGSRLTIAQRSGRVHSQDPRTRYAQMKGSPSHWLSALATAKSGTYAHASAKNGPSHHAAHLDVLCDFQFACRHSVVVNKKRATDGRRQSGTRSPRKRSRIVVKAEPEFAHRAAHEIKVQHELARGRGYAHAAASRYARCRAPDRPHDDALVRDLSLSQ